MAKRNRHFPHGILAVLAPLLLLLLAGCGGADSKKDVLATALSFFPRDAAVVVALDTDTGSAQFKAIDAVGKKFPGWDGVKRELLTDLQEDKIDFEKDMKPWLGNVAVIGVRTARALRAEETPFVGALVARQEEAAKGFFEKLVDNGDMKPAGSHKDAQLYEDPADSPDEDDDYWALDGSVVLAGDTLDELKAVLDVHDSGGSMTVEDFDRAVGGLPDDAILRASLDVQALLESAKDQETVANALRVPWVASLSKLGAVASVSSTEIEVELRLGTDRRDLNDAQLPLPADPQTPTLKVPAEAFWAAGIYDLEHIIRFAEEAAKAVQPAAHASYRAAISEMSQQLGLDIDRDLLGQLKGETILSFDTDGFVLAARLQDPKGMARTLDKLAPVVPSFLKGAGFPGVRSAKQSEAAGTTYQLGGPKGETLATYGVVGDELLVVSGGRDPHAIGSSRTKKLEPGAGALVAVVDFAELFDRVGPASLVDEDIRAMKPISTISGSASNTTQALTAEFKVTIK